MGIGDGQWLRGKSIKKKKRKRNKEKRELKNGKWVMRDGRGNKKWRTRNGDSGKGMVNMIVPKIYRYCPSLRKEIFLTRSMPPSS